MATAQRILLTQQCVNFARKCQGADEPGVALIWTLFLFGILVQKMSHEQDSEATKRKEKNYLEIYAVHKLSR
jgi:hypothetical protein